MKLTLKKFVTDVLLGGDTAARSALTRVRTATDVLLGGDLATRVFSIIIDPTYTLPLEIDLGEQETQVAVSDSETGVVLLHEPDLIYDPYFPPTPIVSDETFAALEGDGETHVTLVVSESSFVLFFGPDLIYDPYFPPTVPVSGDTFAEINGETSTTLVVSETGVVLFLEPVPVDPFFVGE